MEYKLHFPPPFAMSIPMITPFVNTVCTKSNNRNGPIEPKCHFSPWHTNFIIIYGAHVIDIPNANNVTIIQTFCLSIHPSIPIEVNYWLHVYFHFRCHAVCAFDTQIQMHFKWNVKRVGQRERQKFGDVNGLLFSIAINCFGNKHRYA